MTPITDTFTFERDFPLSPDRMWLLLTDPKLREQWGAPGENSVLEMISSDLREGGEDHHRCGPADDPEFEVRTRWYHLNAPEMAVFTEVIEAGGARLGASLVTYQITAQGSGASVHITVAVSSFVGAEMIDEFRAGWSGGVENLMKLATAQGPAA